MSAVGNKHLVLGVFEALSKGDSRPFVELLADDVRWTVMGTTPWSKTYRGKESVLAVDRTCFACGLTWNHEARRRPLDRS